MTELIACLSTGKGTWEHVRRLTNEEEWENIILITNDFGKENFKPSKKVEFIIIDPNKFLSELTKELTDKLKGKVKGIEVALNLVSGTGKEHMALLSALMKLGIGIRLIAITPKGVKEI